MATEEQGHQPSESGENSENGHGGHGHGHGHGAYEPSMLQRADGFYGGIYQQICDWLKIPSGAHALEAGSGAGGFTELLSGAVGTGGTVAALDVTPELLQTVRERVQKSPLEPVSGLRHLPRGRHRTSALRRRSI